MIMKSLKKLILTLFASAAAIGQAHALAPGDIAFVGYNADGTDGFAFIATATIPAGTVIRFQDNEWNGLAIGSGGAFNTGEGATTWTNGGSDLAPGTVVELLSTSNSGSRSVNTGTLSGSTISLGNSGESIFAFEGTSDTAPTAFLAAITNNNGGFNGATTSGLLAGTGLTAGSTALVLPGTGGADVAAYNPTLGGSTFSRSAALAAFNTASNWVAQDAGGDQDADNTTPDAPFRTDAQSPISGVTFTISSLPAVNLSVSASTGTEAAATVITVTATASAAVTLDQTVSLAITGTGITAGDYTLSNATITILDGQTTGTVTFTVFNDGDYEGNETATLTISSPSAGITLGATTAQNVAITDDEAPPLVSPMITVQPTPAQNVVYNATANLTVVATGNPTPTYQWYQGLSGDTSTPVGTDSPSFTTPALTANTSYWVRATNSQGSADSNTAAITVILSADANLSALALSTGAYSRVFSSSVINYVQVVPDATTSLTVTPTTANGAATVTVNGSPVTSGSPSGSISLNPGINTVTVLVTAQDGTTTKSYTATVIRQSSTTLAAGSIAFTGFNADGNDNLAFVALTAIPQHTAIFFTDEEWNGTNWASYTECSYVWVANANIAAGTVVTLDDLSTIYSNGATSNNGTIIGLSDANNNAGMGNSDESIFAFQGTGSLAGSVAVDAIPDGNLMPVPSIFLALIANEDEAGAVYSLAGTGLSEAAGTAIIFPNDDDGTRYKGSRSSQTSYAGYLPLIADRATNWDSIGGGDGTTYLPFNTTAFTLAAIPTVELSVSANAGTEAASTVITVTATASAAVAGDQTVDLAVTGTGITGGDYTLSNAVITILDGQTTGSVTFTIFDDMVYEGTETATLTISNPTSGITLGTTLVQNVAITDNDPASSGPYTNANRDILAANTTTWSPGGVTLNGTTFVNLGLQGVGRVPASTIDSATGETLGSVSDMQISKWRKNGDGSYSGTFNFLPDRGYNSGAIYSNYAARLNNFDFTFTPYTSSAITGLQNQIAMTFTGSERFTYDHDANSGTAAVYTTGLNATGTGTLFGTTVPTASGNSTQSDGTVNNRLTLDSEGLVLDKRTGKVGAGWIGDEYGASVYHFNSAKQIDGQLILPAALIPHKPATTTRFDGTPDNGRRDNQGIEGIAQSPDGTRLFVLLQSATIQDSGSGNQGRSNTRLLVYDISSTDTPTDPIDQYVIQLPRVDTNGDLAVDRTGAQSAIVALNDHQILILARDGNGRGAAGAPIFKSVLLADLTTATDIDGTYDAEAAQVSPAGTLSGSITPLNWTEALNLIGKLDLSVTEVEQFGLNLNAAPGDINSICEKWEALSLVSANDPAFPNDYFLFVGNDNDFVTSSIKYLDAAGTVQTAVGALENDTVVLAFRVRMTGTFNQAPLVPNSLVDQAAVATTAFSYTFAANSFADPESGTLSYVATRLDDSALPAWLSFNPATRSFSGTPTGADVGSLLVKVTATDDGTPALATSTCFTITVGPAPLTPIEAWRQFYFDTTENTGLTADDADFDGDCVLNLMEYALGSDPTLTSGVEAQAALPVGVLNDSGDPLLSDRYSLSFTINSPAPTDLTYTVEAGDDLENWTAIAESTGDSTWTWLAGGTSHIVVGTPSAGRVTIKVGDMVPQAGHPKRMMRLKASK